MKSPKERYESDPQFHALVNIMISYIQQAQFTPTEMREAAVLASIIYEQHNIRHPWIMSKELEKWLNSGEYAQFKCEKED